MKLNFNESIGCFILNFFFSKVFSVFQSVSCQTLGVSNYIPYPTVFHPYGLLNKKILEYDRDTNQPYLLRDKASQINKEGILPIRENINNPEAIPYLNDGAVNSNRKLLVTNEQLLNRNEAIQDNSKHFGQTLNTPDIPQEIPKSKELLNPRGNILDPRVKVDPLALRGNGYGEQDGSTGMYRGEDNGGARRREDNSKLLSQLREVETFPIEKQRSSISRQLQKNDDESYNNAIPKTVSCVHKMFPHDYVEDKEERHPFENHFLVRQLKDNFANSRVVTGNTVEFRSAERQNVNTVPRAHKKKDSDELPQNKERKGKRIIKIVTKTDMKYLNTPTVNDDLKINNEMMSSEINKRNDGDCVLCKSMNGGERNRKSNQKNKEIAVDPNCEFCIRDIELGNTKSTINKKLDKEDYLDNSEIEIKSTTCSSPEEYIRKIKELLDNFPTSTIQAFGNLRENQEVLVTNRHADHQYNQSSKYSKRTKTTTIGEICNRNLCTDNERDYQKDIVTQNISYSNTKNNDFENERLRRRNQDKMSRTGRYNDGNDRRESEKRNRVNKSNDIDKKEKIRRTTIRDIDHDDDDDDNEEEIRVKKKAAERKSAKKKKGQKRNQRKHGRHRNSKKHIRKVKQCVQNKNYGNRKINYVEPNVDTDDSVKQKANNLRYILLEKIKDHNEKTFDNSEDYEFIEKEHEVITKDIDESIKTNYDDTDEFDEDIETKFDVSDIKNKAKTQFKKKDNYETACGNARYSFVCIKDALQSIIEMEVSVYHKLFDIVRVSFDRLNLEEKHYTIILSFLGFIIFLLICIYVGLRESRLQDVDAIDSEARLEWVSMHMTEKTPCPSIRDQTTATYLYQEIQKDDRCTGPSYSEILKDLYLPDRTFGTSEASLQPLLEFGDIEQEPRKILHGRRISGKCGASVKK